MLTIRRVSAPSAEDAAQLCALLIDSVDGGASVGFLAPLTRERAMAYWQAVFSNLGDDLLCWIAEKNGEIVGTVQLSLCAKENGSHRAEVQKLQVKQTHRGQGISTALMNTAEEYAASIGRRLLVLDTEAGSLAETVYQHRGWQKSGEIPQYAGLPSGRLIATAIYYKLI
jgi:acetyltransferase